MSDPRQSVRPGQRLEIAASQINFLNQLMASNVTPVSGPLAGWEPAVNVALVKNTTGLIVPRWGVLAITGVEIDPTDGTAAQRQFEEMPCLTGSVPTNSTVNNVAVALEPVANGKIGRFAVGGMFPCKVKTTYAAPYGNYARGRVNDTTQLITSNCGPIRLLWTEGYLPGDDKWAIGLM